MKTWIIAIAALLTGFGAGYYSHSDTTKPLDDLYEFKSVAYGSNNSHRALKINRKTGETWAMFDHSWVRIQ